MKMENNSNLYLDIANVLLDNFNGLVEQHKNDFLINSSIGVAAFIATIAAILFLVQLINNPYESEDASQQRTSNNEENRLTKIQSILASCTCVIISAACLVFYVHLDNHRIQEIQNQTIQLQHELSTIAKKYNVESQVVNNLAQDVILCEKNYLIIQSNLNFSFECKDKKYSYDPKSFITTFYNIDKLNNAINNRKTLIFNK